MQSEPFTGTTAQMKKSPWLASEDLAGLSSPELVIDGVYRNTDVEMEGGRKEKELFSIAFKGASKQMILNATNRRALSRSFGADTKKWIGQKVKLYVQDNVKMGGKIVCGLRIAVPPPAARVPVVGKPEQGAESTSVPFALDPKPETSLERLRRKLIEDNINEAKLAAWLDRESLPTLDLLMENEAEAVLALYPNLLREAK